MPNDGPKYGNRARFGDRPLARDCCLLGVGLAMTEYLKFWLAKELAPLAIILVIAAFFAFLYFAAVIFDAARDAVRRKNRQ